MYFKNSILFVILLLNSCNLSSDSYKNPNLKSYNFGDSTLRRPQKAWNPLGPHGGTVSYGHSSDGGFIVDNEGMPYVVYTDIDYGFRTTVKKYNGKFWDIVGPQGGTVSDGEACNNNIMIDNNNSAVVAYLDKGQNNRIRVRRYNGSYWGNIGSYVSAGIAASPVLAADHNNNYYIAYHDIKQGMAFVKKYNGADWEIIDTVNYQKIKPKDMVIDSYNNIYISYIDELSMGVIRKYNGSKWENIKEIKDIQSISLDINNNNLYAAFSTRSLHDEVYEISAVLYDGKSWISIGTIDKNLYGFDNLSLALDHNAIPYLAYISKIHRETIIAEYNGYYWERIGKASFSKKNILFLNLDVSYGNTPYLYFIDTENDQKSTVMKYDYDTPH